MGTILIYGVILLLIFLSLGIVLFIKSKKQKSKVGLVISLIMFATVILVLMTNSIDELTISKKDIVTDLKHIDIELIDDFEINNNIVTGMPERIQETIIQTTQRDKDRIISKIRNSANFESYVDGKQKPEDINLEQFENTSEIYNFQYPEFYSRETYKRIDSFPTRLILSIYYNNNTIKYLRIED